MRSPLFTYFFVLVLVVLTFVLWPWPIRRNILEEQLKICFGRLAVFLALTGIMMRIMFAVIAQLNQGPEQGGQHTETFKQLAIYAEVWILPLIAFISMLLVAFNLLKGVLRRIGYWYPLIFFACAITHFIPAFYYFYGPVRLIFFLTAIFWAYGFWENSGLSATMIKPDESGNRQTAASTSKISPQMFFAMVVWLVPVIALPFYLLAYIGAGLSAGSPNVSFGDFTLLTIAPVVALLTWLAIFILGKISTKFILGTIIPVLLCLAELTFALLLWKAG